VLPYIGDLALRQIHDGNVAPFVEARLADGKAAGTINRTLAVVHCILTLAARAWRDEQGVTRLTCSRISRVAIVRVTPSSGCVTALGDAHVLRSGYQNSKSTIYTVLSPPGCEMLVCRNGR
jgi:hypothetical protein